MVRYYPTRSTKSRGTRRMRGGRPTSSSSSSSSAVCADEATFQKWEQDVFAALGKSPKTTLAKAAQKCEQIIRPGVVFVVDVGKDANLEGDIELYDIRREENVAVKARSWRNREDSGFVLKRYMATTSNGLVRGRNGGFVCEVGSEPWKDTVGIALFAATGTRKAPGTIAKELLERAAKQYPTQASTDPEAQAQVQPSLAKWVTSVQAVAESQEHTTAKLHVAAPVFRTREETPHRTKNFRLVVPAAKVHTELGSYYRKCRSATPNRFCREISDKSIADGYLAVNVDDKGSVVDADNTHVSHLSGKFHDEWFVCPSASKSSKLKRKRSSSNTRKSSKSSKSSKTQKTTK